MDVSLPLGRPGSYCVLPRRPYHRGPGCTRTWRAQAPFPRASENLVDPPRGLLPRSMSPDIPDSDSWHRDTATLELERPEPAHFPHRSPSPFEKFSEPRIDPTRVRDPATFKHHKTPKRVQSVDDSCTDCRFSCVRVFLREWRRKSGTCATGLLRLNTCKFLLANAEKFVFQFQHLGFSDQ